MKHIISAALLLTATFSSTSALASNQLEWNNLMQTAVNLQTDFDYESNVDSYMKLYRSAVWKKYKNDEFELEDKRQETITMMKNKFSKFDMSEEYVINTNFSTDKYDFKKQSFPINGVSESSYYQANNYSAGTFPRTFRVMFSNANMIGDLDMPKAEAKNFIKARKDRYGSIDRKVPVKLTFKIKSLDSDGFTLKAELTNVTLYANKKRSKVLAEF
jgi:hypothetical protein